MESGVSQKITDNSQESGEVEYEGSVIPYKIRRNPRSKRVIIKVTSDRTVTIVAPPKFQASKIHTFAMEWAAWIHKKTLGSPRPLPPARKYCIGEVYPWFGGEIRLMILKGRETSVSVNDKEIVAFIPDGLNNSEEDFLVRNLLLFCFRNALYKYSLPYFRGYSEKIGIPLPILKVNDKKGSWGTCTPKSIILNLRLCMAPPDIIAYVIAHELCHKIEPNHSPRFWKTLEKVLPDYKDRMTFLKENGYLWTL